MKYLSLSLVLSFVNLCNTVSAQIHVGPKNNVGIRTGEDTTVSIRIENSGDELERNTVNILSNMSFDTAVTNEYCNSRLYNQVSYSKSAFPYLRTYGLYNRSYNTSIGSHDHRWGIYNLMLEPDEILDQSLPYNTLVYGLENRGMWSSNAFHTGMSNVNYQSAGNGPRYGIDNILSTLEVGEQFVNGDQIALKNVLFAVPGTFTPIALYSHISGSNQYAGYFNGDVHITGRLTGGMISDSLLKENIQPLTYGLDEILQMNVVEFEYIEHDHHNLPTGVHHGLVAQELEQIIPELILDVPFIIPSQQEEILDGNGEVVSISHVPGSEEIYKTIEYTELIPVLIKAIQEQQVMIDALEQQVGGLQQNNPKGK